MKAEHPITSSGQQNRGVGPQTKLEIVPDTLIVQVSHGSSQHDVAVDRNSTFGDLKSIIVQKIGLNPERHKLLFRGKEKEDDEGLQAAGVKDNAKVLLIEDDAFVQKIHEEGKEAGVISRGGEAVAKVREEVDKLAGQVAELQATVENGTKVDDKNILYLTEMLMKQLLKLDGIEAEGDGKVLRKAEVRRVQCLVETMDAMKLRSPNPCSNVNKIASVSPQWETFESASVSSSNLSPLPTPNHFPSSPQASNPPPPLFPPASNPPPPLSPQASNPPPVLPQASNLPPPLLPQASNPPPLLPQASNPPPLLRQATNPPPLLPQASKPPSLLPQATNPSPWLRQATNLSALFPQASNPSPLLPQASNPSPLLPQASNPPPWLRQVTNPPSLLPHALHTTPSSSHAPYADPSSSYAPFTDPSWSQSLYTDPSWSHAPYTDPYSSHAPYADPYSSHAPYAGPSLSHAPYADPPSSHSPYGVHLTPHVHALSPSVSIDNVTYTPLHLSSQYPYVAPFPSFASSPVPQSTEVTPDWERFD